jgi:hypothetical protein
VRPTRGENQHFHTRDKETKKKEYHRVLEGNSRNEYSENIVENNANREERKTA